MVLRRARVANTYLFNHTSCECHDGNYKLGWRCSMCGRRRGVPKVCHPPLILKINTIVIAIVIYTLTMADLNYGTSDGKWQGQYWQIYAWWLSSKPLFSSDIIDIFVASLTFHANAYEEKMFIDKAKEIFLPCSESLLYLLESRYNHTKVRQDTNV